MINRYNLPIGGLVLAVFALAAVPAAQAGPLTISDSYSTGATNSPDVIGDARRFDAKQIVFLERSATNWVVEVHANYNNGDAGLNPFRLNGNTTSHYLHVGDLLFSTDGTNYNYGVPLDTHDGNSNSTVGNPNVTQGHLYGYDGSGGFTLTSNVAYGGPGTYRFGQPVWINPSNATHQGNGTSTSTNTGNLVITTLSFTPSPQFWSDYAQNGLFVRFASATCGNDLIDGYIPGVVPEPSAYVVMAFGLAFVGFQYRRRSAAKARIS